jgi:hypothetical protein
MLVYRHFCPDLYFDLPGIEKVWRSNIQITDAFVYPFLADY